MMDGLQMPEVDRNTPRVYAGRYQVERMIARGGMGEVYLCTDRDLNRPVALKLLRGGVDSEDGGRFMERFRLEARTLATLNHPNIVTLYEYGETEDGQLFLALEYIEGPRFTDLVRKGPMDPNRVISLTMQVCRALRFAHRRGVVHRDLKPSNLLVRIDEDGEEQIKVVDFGLVKFVEDDQALTRAGLILGSPHCMAPEQIRGLKDVDPRADIYAVGVLMFRALTGVWPFHGDTSTATMIAHINQATPRFGDVYPDGAISPGLEDIVRQCLEKNPDARFADVHALMAALRALTGQPATVTHSSIETSIPAPIESSTITASAQAVTSASEARRESSVRTGIVGQSQLALVGVGAGLAAVLLLIVVVIWSLSRDTVEPVEPLAPPPAVEAPAVAAPEVEEPVAPPTDEGAGASTPPAEEPPPEEVEAGAEEAGSAAPPPEPPPRPKPRPKPKPKAAEPAPPPAPPAEEPSEPAPPVEDPSSKPTERDATYDADVVFE